MTRTGRPPGPATRLAGDWAVADVREVPGLEERFWAKVERHPGDGCWRWTAAVGPGGYGLFHVVCKEPMRVAHRVAWVLTHGPLGPGLFVLHRCDNPGCVRPSHLFTGTYAENMLDMSTKRRHPGQKITPEDAEAIRHLAATGGTHSSIAEQFSISRNHVTNIVNRKRHQYRA